jgi:hypothetical protein
MTLFRFDTCLLCGQAVLYGPMEELWRSVEGCACGGFMVEDHVWRFRLPTVAEPERRAMHKLVQAIRRSGATAWVMTAGPRPGGPMVVHAGLAQEGWASAPFPTLPVGPVPAPGAFRDR